MSGGVAGSRRAFLKRSAAVVATASAGACGRRGEGEGEGATAQVVLPGETLRAVGKAVLPGELGADGTERAVAAFERWAADLEPVAELRHSYLVPGVRYSGPDPRPGWAAQLQGLEMECMKRHGTSLAEAEIGQRREMLASRVQEARGDFGPPAEAGHVAVALMAHFYRSAVARDLCYRRAIGQEQCRGLAGAGDEPAALGGASA